MQILLALIFGASYGGLLHFLMPARDSRGVAVAPILGALIGGTVWLALTWAGITTGSAWIWLASAAAPAALVPIALAVLRRVRDRHDARERVRLGIA